MGEDMGSPGGISRFQRFDLVGAAVAALGVGVFLVTRPHGPSPPDECCDEPSRDSPAVASSAAHEGIATTIVLPEGVKRGGNVGDMGISIVVERSNGIHAAVEPHGKTFATAFLDTPASVAEYLKAWRADSDLDLLCVVEGTKERFDEIRVAAAGMYEVVWDPDGKAASAYGVSAFPHFALIRDGMVTSVVRSVSPEELRAALREHGGRRD